MKTYSFRFILIVFSLLFINSYVSAVDIQPIGPLQPSGSDAQGQAFNAYSSTINSYIFDHTISTPPGMSFFATDTATASVITDPSNVQLQTTSEVRAYFLSAPAPNAADAFGFNANHDYMLTSGQQALIFNTNVPAGSLPNTPTASGDFVDLGALQAGTFLDFFLMAQDASGDSTVWWNDPSQNADGFPHLQMVQFLNTPYYLLAWEDTDLFARDDGNLYRSLFAVVEVNGVVVPEPSTYLILASLLAACLILGHRRRATKVVAKAKVVLDPRKRFDA